MATVTTPSSLNNLSLARVIKDGGVQRALRGYLPQTKRYVEAINRSDCNEMKIPPSAWVEKHKRHSLVGTAFDCLVGLLWANQHDDSIFEKLFSRVVERMDSGEILFRNGKFQSMCRFGGTETAFGLLQSLRDLIISELPSVRNRKGGERQKDFFRGIALLADFDSMARAAGAPVPEWISSGKIRGANKLRGALRTHYPAQFVGELQRLIKAAQEDLPSGSVEYNPIFGARAGQIAIGADGDLLIDDLLLEMKVVKAFQPHYLWQLLGYAVLDANRGNQRIRLVGLYNPRYRALWIRPIDDLVRDLGGTDFERFRRWFNADIEKALLKVA